MRFKHRILLVVAALASLLSHPARPQSAVVAVEHGPNAVVQQSKHYVVLVSLDGFRYDYPRKYGAKNLLALGHSGAMAGDGMIPSYPSLTFPNHYTLVTGLYPEHHGIVANTFYDPARRQRYSYRDQNTNTDGSWYGGTPLWVLAEKQGMRTACFFWPSSEAEIQNTRPSYYLKFDDRFPDEKRVDQVLEWLRLPPERRPHFITLYYSNVDHAGHEFGPDAPQTRAAVLHVDELIGELRRGLDALKLPIDLIVVSDHGMERESDRWIDLDSFPGVDLANFDTADSLLYARTPEAAEAAYQALKKASPDFVVYRRKNMPAGLHYSTSERIGDPVIVPTGPYAIRAHAPPAGSTDRPPLRGAHGYDPHTMPDMRAIFFAAGPDIHPGVSLRPFENVNVYPLIAHLLGLEAPPVDGSLNVLSTVLNQPAP